MGRKEPKSLWECWKIYWCSISKISDSILYCFVFSWQQSLGIQCCRLKLRAVQFWFLLVWFLALHQLVWSYPEAWWKMATVSAWFGMVMVFYVIFNEDMQRSWLVVCSFAWIFCGSGWWFPRPCMEELLVCYWFFAWGLNGVYVIWVSSWYLHGVSSFSVVPSSLSAWAAVYFSRLVEDGLWHGSAWNLT